MGEVIYAFGRLGGRCAFFRLSGRFGLKTEGGVLILGYPEHDDFEQRRFALLAENPLGWFMRGWASLYTVGNQSQFDVCRMMGASMNEWSE